MLRMSEGTRASVSLVEEIWISVTENTSDAGKCHEEAKESSPVTGGTEGAEFWAKMNEEKEPLCHHPGDSMLGRVNGKSQSPRRE